jgi:signal transduction histidine kinase/putative methionine-R-sulfoxide reductase with GAF domain
MLVHLPGSLTCTTTPPPALAAVTVPGLAVVLLVVATAVGVWAVMTWWRLRGSRLRLLGRLDELTRRHEAMTLELNAVRLEHGASGEVLDLQKSRTEVLRLRARTLERILAVSARLNATRNPGELMDRIVGAVGETTRFRRVVLHVWSDVSRAFAARAYAGVDPAGRHELGSVPVPAEEFQRLSQVKHRLGNCFLVRADDRELFESGCDGAPPVVSREWTPDLLLVAPLVSADGETVGYLSLDDPADGLIPGLVEIRQLEFLVQQATTAIESAEVYQKLARNNAELSLASEKLNSLADLKKNFIANVSHELRTPLTSISAYTELLQNNLESLSGDSREEFLKVIHAESVKLTGIINDILDLGRMDNGRPAFAHEETDMAALVKRLDTSWRTRALERDIDLLVDVGYEQIAMPVDNMLIQQLLTHLVGNAFKFTPNGGRVHIRLQETGTAVRLTVEDSGIGIPEDKLGEIFDRFFQVDGSTTRVHNGQGVGLALCHEIVSSHDGRIWAENVETGGARLVVLLPRRPAVLQRTDTQSVTGLPFEAGEFMQRLMLWVSESLGIQVATLLVPDKAGEHLIIQAAIGLPEAVVQSARIRRGSGFSGKVWATGRTLLVGDLTSDDRFEHESNEPRYSTPSLLCVPLLAGNEVLGVITVNNRIDGRPLDDDDRIFLESLAPRLANLLQRYAAWQDGARDFERVRGTLRATTAVGHLRHETIMQVCQEICLAAARHIQLPPDELEHLAFALQFYDVGLGCVPPQLLNKPRLLTPVEANLVERHVDAGLEILEPLRPDSRVRQIITHHHENFDGSGYPSGLSGEAIPLGARLVRLTDTLSALLCRRPWRGAYSLAEAVDELRSGAGTHYCPRLTDVFLAELELRRGRILELQAAGNDGRELKRAALDRRGMISVPV